MRRWMLVGVLALLPTGVLAKTATGAQEAAAPQFQYLGQTFALDASCSDGEAFIVGQQVTLLGTSVTVLYVFPLGGASTPMVIGPKDRAATGAYAGKGIGDGLCLVPTAPAT